MAKIVTVYLNEETEKILQELTKDGKKISPLINSIITDYYHNVSEVKDDFAELFRITGRISREVKQRGMLFLDELPSEMVEKIKKYKKATEELKEELE